MYATPIDSEVIQKIISQHGYDLDGFLGFGGFASAYKIVHRSYQMEFVLKVMNLKSLTGDMEVAQKQIKSYDCELNALKNLCHANIINIYDHFSSEEALFIVLEYCPGGSLDDLIQKKIPVKNMFPVFKQVLLALKYCHDHGIVHRDIKPANILFDKYGRPKLADFGLADFVSPDRIFKGMTGSRVFLAPEVWSKNAFDAKKADIWALGVTFYMMVTTQIPWDMTSPKSFENSIKTGYFNVDQSMDQDFIDIVSMMLTVDPAQRASLEDILALPAFKNVTSNATICNMIHMKNIINMNRADPETEVAEKIKQFQMYNPMKAVIRSVSYSMKTKSRTRANSFMADAKSNELLHLAKLQPTLKRRKLNDRSPIVKPLMKSYSTLPMD